MLVQDLDISMNDVRSELTQITRDLVEVDRDLIYVLQRRRTQLLTQLQHLETLRWFSPLAPLPRLHTIQGEVTIHESKPIQTNPESDRSVSP